VEKSEGRLEKILNIAHFLIAMWRVTQSEELHRSSDREQRSFRFSGRRADHVIKPTCIYCGCNVFDIDNKLLQTIYAQTVSFAQY